jgi:hypothetical protein
MADLLARVRLAVQLDDARAAARLLFGDEYEARIEPWRAFVRERCRAWGCRPLQVVPRLYRDGTLPDQYIALVVASADVAAESKA